MAKMRTIEGMLEQMRQDPDFMEKAIKMYNLIGDKDYRLNLVWVYEQRGIDLLTALEAADRYIKALKIYSKETYREAI